MLSQSSHLFKHFLKTLTAKLKFLEIEIDGELSKYDKAKVKYHKCSYCKKKFKKACALGGHTSQYHKRAKEEESIDE